MQLLCIPRFLRTHLVTSRLMISAVQVALTGKTKWHASICGILSPILINAYNCVFLLQQRAIILHPRVSERGPYNISICDFGCKFGWSPTRKQEDMLSTCGILLIDSSKMVTNVCPFLATTMQLFLHLKIIERGPHNVSIGDFGATWVVPAKQNMRTWFSFVGFSYQYF